MKLRKNKRNRIAITMFFIIYAFINSLPLWYILVNSFKKLEYIYINPMAFIPEAFTLSNFVSTWKLMNFPTLLFNNFKVTIISITMMISLSAPAAYGIVIGKNKVTNALYVFLVTLITIPIQIVMIPLVVKFRDMGLINSFLGLSVFFTALSVPLVIFLYVGYMKTVPYELYEAAVVDGCGVFRTFLVIYLPLAKAITGTVLIIRGVFVWNDLLIPLIMITEPKKSLLVLRLYLFAGSWSTGWDKLFAGSLLVTLPVTLFYLLLQRQFVSGIVAGAVKG